MVLMDSMSKIFNLGEARKVEAPGISTTYMVVDKEMGALKMMALVYDYEPNLDLKKVHYHVNRESAYLILEGEARLHLNGENHVVGPGTFVYLSPGDVHGVIGTGEKGLKYLEFWAPQDKDVVYLEDGVTKK